MFTQTQNTAPTLVADAVTPQADPPAPTALPTTVALKDGELAGEKPRILDEVVIEEVSIDGMCGVY